MHLRKVVIACLLLLAVSGAAVTGWWHYIAARAEASFVDWTRQIEEQGYGLTYASLERSGFPTEVEFVLREAVLTSDPSAAGARIRIPFLRARFPAWDPQTIRFASPDGIDATLPSGNDIVELSARDLQGTVYAEEDAGRRRHWLVRGETSILRAARELPDDALFTAEGATFAVDIPEILLVSRDAVAMLRIESLLSGITLPAPTALGETISELMISSELTAPLPANWSGPALAAWRERGGRITLHQGAMSWGPLGLQGNGQITLDAALRPEGTIEVLARGYEAALDALADEGILATNQLPAIKLALAFMSREPAPGAPREAGARLDFEDGWLKLGPFRLAPLPSLVPH